jgi:hypothetical protein
LVFVIHGGALQSFNFTNLKIQMNNNLSQIKISVLDLAIVPDGNPADTFKSSLELAQKVENWGYLRFWLAEHHNIQVLLVAQLFVLIGHI